MLSGNLSIANLAFDRAVALRACLSDVRSLASSLTGSSIRPPAQRRYHDYGTEIISIESFIYQAQMLELVPDRRDPVTHRAVERGVVLTADGSRLTAQGAGWQDIGLERVRKLIPRVIRPSPSQPLFQDTGVSGIVWRTDTKKAKEEVKAARKAAKQQEAAAAAGRAHGVAQQGGVAATSTAPAAAAPAAVTVTAAAVAVTALASGDQEDDVDFTDADKGKSRKRRAVTKPAASLALASLSLTSSSNPPCPDTSPSGRPSSSQSSGKTRKTASLSSSSSSSSSSSVVSSVSATSELSSSRFREFSLEPMSSLDQRVPGQRGGTRAAAKAAMIERQQAQMQSDRQMMLEVAFEEDVLDDKADSA